MGNRRSERDTGTRSKVYALFLQQGQVVCFGKCMADQLLTQDSTNYPQIKILCATMAPYDKFHMGDPQFWSNLKTSLLSGMLSDARTG